MGHIEKLEEMRSRRRLKKKLVDDGEESDVDGAHKIEQIEKVVKAGERSTRYKDIDLFVLIYVVTFIREFSYKHRE